MDRERARRNLNVGLSTAAIAIFVFGMVFFVAINYLA
jgi:hypothetical protein